MNQLQQERAQLLRRQSLISIRLTSYKCVRADILTASENCSH